MLAKVACNATNSAAIDNKGCLYVWGFTNYGLCGSNEIQTSKDVKAGKKKGGVPEGPLNLKPIKVPMYLPTLNDESLKFHEILAEKKKVHGMVPYLPLNMLDPNPVLSE